MKWLRRWRAWRRRAILFSRGPLHIWQTRSLDAETLVIKLRVSKALLAEAEHDDKLANLMADTVRETAYDTIRRNLVPHRS